MVSKTDWLTLSHEEKIQVLAERPVDQILEDYSLVDKNQAAFRELLAREHRLWTPENIQKLETAGSPPTKDVVLGAWRDLDRSEALLELIDNSIDVWRERRGRYPKKTSPELNIYIDVDPGAQQLIYEDNAGGVSIDKLVNLVVPGFSDTTPLSKTIGSYKTGGKKAIFRLGTAASITTRYWNPAETSDDAISVQLDEPWINDPIKYEFNYAQLKDKAVIERGQTRYVLQLREEPVGGPLWIEDPNKINKIVQDIRKTYGLLITRSPAIQIHFKNRRDPLSPVEDFYSFSGTNTDGVNIEPQQVIFATKMEFGGDQYEVEIEFILGCRTTSGASDGSWGIDLYGNDRLFVAYDQDTFSRWLPQGGSRNLIRGLVNIHGANFFIPWDTHKRHLNVDREIIQILTKHKLIEELFENWRRIYNDISRSGQVSKLIKSPLPQNIDKKDNDLYIPNRAKVSLDPNARRGVALPKTIYVPKVKAKRKKNDTINIRLSLTTVEARLLASHYGIEGDPASNVVGSELASEIKADALKRARGKRK